MDPVTAARASSGAISGLASHFMLDGPTYAHGVDLGFAGLDFYVYGRGGALGGVPGDVVAATFVFFEPGNVRAQWEAGAKVMDPIDASRAFIGCGHRWADAHLPDGPDHARLAAIAGRVIETASSAGAPLFAAWRQIPEPDSLSDRALALHRMNVLRELRNALHGAAVLAAGLTPVEAVSHRSPHMVAMFGWPEAATGDTIGQRWQAAEDATDVAMGVVLSALDPSDREAFATLANEVAASVN